MISPLSPILWTHLDRLVQSYDIIIYRPQGSRYPRISTIIYPLEYGHLAGTST